MAAYEQQLFSYLSKPKSPVELESWMAAAVSVLRGNEISIRGGQKSVKMNYRWVNYTSSAGAGEPSEFERNEDVEVE
jgi:hypothetical protein